MGATKTSAVKTEVMEAVYVENNTMANACREMMVILDESSLNGPKAQCCCKKAR